MKTKIKYLLICIILIAGSLSGCIGKEKVDSTIDDKYQDVEKQTGSNFIAQVSFSNIHLDVNLNGNLFGNEKDKNSKNSLLIIGGIGGGIGGISSGR